MPISHDPPLRSSRTIRFLSPFRYPGGKTQLIPYVRRWLQSLSQVPEELIEPFAGGASIGLAAAFEGLVKKVTLVERDPEVAAVWQTILNGKGMDLANKIGRFRVSATSVRSVLKLPPKVTKDIAFATIIRNRVRRGGILAPGAGFLKQGERGRGIASRWYPHTLQRRILSIISMKKRIRFIEGDGLKVLEANCTRKRVAFFLDPPYPVAARRLYRYWDVDHERLFNLAKRVRGDFLLTYQDSREIRQLASKYGFALRTINMKNTHHETLTDLIIGKDLRWFSE